MPLLPVSQEELSPCVFVWPCHSFLGHWGKPTPGWAFEDALKEGSPHLTSPCVRGCVFMHVHWSGTPSTQTLKRHTCTSLAFHWTPAPTWGNKTGSLIFAFFMPPLPCCCTAAAASFKKVVSVQFGNGWKPKRLNWRSNYCGRCVGKRRVVTGRVAVRWSRKMRQLKLRGQECYLSILAADRKRPELR